MRVRELPHITNTSCVMKIQKIQPCRFTSQKNINGVTIPLWLGYLNYLNALAYKNI